MNTIRRHLSKLAPLLMVCGTSIGADDDVEMIEPTAPQNVVRWIVVAPQQPQMRASVFDRSIFGTDADSARQQIELQIRTRIYQLSVDYGLTEAQQKKLALAADGELRHFFREVDDCRRRFESMTNGHNAFQVVGVQELREEKSHLFGPDSFFAKVSSKMVTTEQIANHQAAVQGEHTRRQRIRHRSNVESAVREIERKVDLRLTQHVALVSLLLRETRPAKTFGNYDDTVVKFRFARLPESKLKPLFDDDQWPQACQVFDSFREFGPMLDRHGLIENDEMRSTNSQDGDGTADAAQPEN